MDSLKSELPNVGYSYNPVSICTMLFDFNSQRSCCGIPWQKIFWDGLIRQKDNGHHVKVSTITAWLRSAVGHITGVSTPLFGVQWQRTANAERPRPALALPERLLGFLWHYPVNAGEQASWATKDSLVLRGRLDSAKDQPGLGVAMVTTEVAQRVFGSKASDRIDICIRWAHSRTENKKPFFIEVDSVNPITSRVEVIADFRHTVAFAVLLARFGRYHSLLENYLEAVLALQRHDEGWAPGGGTTVSEVFAVVYVAEFLALCSKNQTFSSSVREKCEKAHVGALRWLLSNRTADRMWTSGVLTDYSWDDLWTTAWLIHRLCPFDSGVDGIKTQWSECLSDALIRMITRATNRRAWAETNNNQRNRVEARVAAAAAKALRSRHLDTPCQETLKMYLVGWKRQATEWATGLAENELDIATVAFLIDGLYERGELNGLVNRVCRN